MAWKKRAVWWIVVLAVCGALLLWWFMSQPFYRPGDVRAEKNLRGPLQPPSQPAAGDQWQVESDVALFHFASGTGRNVLFIHGGPGFPSREPAAGFRALEDRFRVHYYAQRGCGGSTRLFERFASRNTWDNMKRLERGLGIGAQLADIERIRRILGEDKLVLVGHSFGGFFAALYAAEFPEHVAALVLIAPASVLLMPAPSGDLFQTIRAGLPESDRAGYDTWLASYLDFGHLFQNDEKQLQAEHLRFADYYGKATGSKPPPASLHPEDVGGWMPMAVYLSMGRHHDYRDALRRVTAPALVLHGADDPRPEAASREYAQLLPKATFRVIPGSGHFVHLEKPAEFAAAVGEFLAATP